MSSQKTKYDHKVVEKKWQVNWQESGIYSPDIKSGKNPFYNLWMFPYPSGEGLHAGHAFASTGSDVYGRFMRMNGKDVFQPIGYDSFGIHSENFAIKVGEHPTSMLKRTTKHYQDQLQSLGHGYDWTRTVTTSDPEYYKWTQWFFVEMFKAGLAYRKKASVNWCPQDKTVLSDEQVIDGKCERCGSNVVKKSLEQWFFRITNYADRLLNNLEGIDWTYKVKVAQKNWIGKKSGARVRFRLTNDNSIEVFTTRIDTIFGATFISVAPQIAQNWIDNGWEASQEVVDYISNSMSGYDGLVDAENREKTGVDTGIYAINPVNQEKIPVFIADYVLTEVGTGAVMGVPAHDQRDFEFAAKYNIPVKRVIVTKDQELGQKNVKMELADEELGVLIDSGNFSGLSSEEAMDKIIAELGNEIASPETHYHLRDWLISRQRYWGPPIPMIYCEHCAEIGKSYFTSKDNILYQDQSDWDHAGWYPVAESSLPILLPHLEDYKPQGSGRGPLADHPEFYTVECPECGSKAKRETDVSDTFLDSAWYFLRYPSVSADSANKIAFDPEITEKWLPVNLYFGGAEHSVLHLMYARFMTMVLYDLKLVSFEEPFPKFYAHGLMIKDGAKMSKSKGNVVNPDHYIVKYGADTLRLYLMFMGPMDGSPDFRDTGIEGMQRFVNKLWEILNQEESDVSEKVVVKRHQTISKVSQDISEFRYNTAIASIMEYVNTLKEQGISLEDKEALSLLLAPFTPHLSEEVWHEVLGHNESIHLSNWPEFDQQYLTSDTLTIAVQVNGKVRSTITINASEKDDTELVLLKAKDDPKVTKWLEDKKIKSEVYVPGRIVNFVTVT